MKPDIVVMLTHHDVTVKNAKEVFEQCSDLPVKHWGFKNVGLPKDQMKELASEMKAAGKETFLEVVTYDEASCLDGAQTAIDCGFDYLMGTIYYDSVAKLLRDNNMEYLPFVGKVSGSPSILEGSNEEIIAQAKGLMAKGIQGLSTIAGLPPWWLEEEKGCGPRILRGGDAQNYGVGRQAIKQLMRRIDTCSDIGLDALMGSALFEKEICSPDGQLRENPLLRAVTGVHG